MGIDELVSRLVGPRSNGSEALAEAASFIEETLVSSAPEVAVQTFSAAPHGIALLTAVSLLLILASSAFLASARYGRALLLATLLPVLMLAEMEWFWSPVSWVFRQPEQNVIATFSGAAGGPTLLFSAHYDTATQFGDHLIWSRWGFATIAALVGALVLGSAALWGARRGRRLPRFIRITAALLIPVPFVAMTWFQTLGPLLAAPSPGALDNAGSVAVLLRLAERLGARPAEAPTTVGLVFFASEEERTLGSWHYARDIDAMGPTAAINLELAGGSNGFAYVPVESLVLRRYRPPQPLIELLDGAAREYLGERVVPAPIPTFSYTAARSFLAHGIPAITLMARFEHGFARGLHTARDSRDRLSEAALERTVDLLEEIVARVDARPGLLEARPARR